MCGHVRMFTFVYAYVHAYVRVCTRIYVFQCMRTCMYAFVRVSTNMLVCVHMFTCVTADDLYGRLFSNRCLPYNVMSTGVREIFNAYKLCMLVGQQSNGSGI